MNLIARRSLLAGLAAAFAAPALVRAATLMPLRGPSLLAPQAVPTVDYTSAESLNYEYWVLRGGSPARMTAREILAAPPGALQPWLPEMDGENFAFRPIRETQRGLMLAKAVSRESPATPHIVDFGGTLSHDPVIVKLREEREALLHNIRTAKRDAHYYREWR